MRNCFAKRLEPLNPGFLEPIITDSPRKQSLFTINNGQFREGMKDALPVVLGYLPVGMAFGLLARNAGLTPSEVGLMSLLVYAGASQFLAVEMIFSWRLKRLWASVILGMLVYWGLGFIM